MYGGAEIIENYGLCNKWKKNALQLGSVSFKHSCMEDDLPK